MGIYFCTDDQGADAKTEEVEKKNRMKKDGKKRGKRGNHLFDVLGARRTLKKGAPPVKSALSSCICTTPVVAGTIS